MATDNTTIAAAVVSEEGTPADNTAMRILNAAGPVFAERGYQAATIREICQAAKVNLASVNYYFRDKERLYIEAVKQAAKLRAEQVPLPDWPPGMPPEVKVRSFVHTLLSRMLGLQESPWQVRLMTREILQPSGATQELVQAYIGPLFQKLQQVIAEIVPGDMPPHRRQQIAFSIIGQCVQYRAAAPIVKLLVPPEELASHFSIDALTDHITGFTLAALGLKEPIGS
ncbi:MAG: CerR family C-terminal domain-containing protein [Planctomycetota bacterium]|nr:CerR family C-terminal domain-containing protein [Planctomycetota bacterium]